MARDTQPARAILISVLRQLEGWRINYPLPPRSRRQCLPRDAPDSVRSENLGAQHPSHDAVIDALDGHFAIGAHVDPPSKMSLSTEALSRSSILHPLSSSLTHFPDLCRAAAMRSPTGFHSIQSCRLISM